MVASHNVSSKTMNIIMNTSNTKLAIGSPTKGFDVPDQIMDDKIFEGEKSKIPKTGRMRRISSKFLLMRAWLEASHRALVKEGL